MSVRRKEKNALHLRKEAAQAHPHIDNRILEGRKSEGMCTVHVTLASSTVEW